MTRSSHRVHITTARERGTDFAEQVLSRAESARASAGGPVAVALGDMGAELYFASGLLRDQFAPSFVATAKSKPRTALTVSLWEPCKKIAPIPPLPWPNTAYRGHGEIPGYSEGRFYFRLEVHLHALTVLDRRTGMAAYINRAPSQLPSYERAGPLRWLIHAFAVDRAMLFAHAAAVSIDGRAALIAGARGAGKSTTTLACLADGFGYLGDDRVLLTAGPPPRVHSIYTIAKIFHEDAPRFPIPGIGMIAAQGRPADDGKIHIPVDAVAGERLVGCSQVAAILVPRRTGLAHSRLIPAAAGDAARLLVAEIIGYSPATAAQSLHLAAAICREAPVFVLEAGTDMRGLARCVGEAISAR